MRALKSASFPVLLTSTVIGVTAGTYTNRADAAGSVLQVGTGTSEINVDYTTDDSGTPTGPTRGGDTDRHDLSYAATAATLGELTPTTIGQQGNKPLTANALVVSDGDTTLCLVTLDVLMMRRHHYPSVSESGCVEYEEGGDGLDEAAEKISDALKNAVPPINIPTNNILISATHTHHAPSTATIHNYGRDQGFVANAIAAAVVAAVKASENLQNADVRFGHLSNNDVGMNSRLLFPSEGLVYWGGAPHDGSPLMADLQNGRLISTGPHDADLQALSFFSPDNTRLGVLFSHNTHNSVSPFWQTEGVASPDLYGIAAQRSGPGVFFFSGASGSSHIFDLSNVEGQISSIMASIESGLGVSESMGNFPELESFKEEFEYDIRNVNDNAETNEIGNYASKFGVPAPETFAHQRTSLASYRGCGKQRTWLQVMRIGDVYIVALPGEVFAKTGLEIKARSPFPRTMVLGLSNDYIGYLPDFGSWQRLPNTDAHTYARGSYQTWAGLHSRSAVGTAENMVDRVISMLNRFAWSPDNQAYYVVPWPGRYQRRHLATFRSTPSGGFDQYIDTESMYGLRALQASDGAEVFDPGLFTSDASGKLHDLGMLVDVTGDGRKDYVVVGAERDTQRHLSTYVAMPNGRFAELVDTTDDQGTFWPDATGRDRGLFARLTDSAASDYVVVYPGLAGERVLAVFPTLRNGRFGQFTETVQGEFLADTTGRDLGQFADVDGDGVDDYVVVYPDFTEDNVRHIATFLGLRSSTQFSFADVVESIDHNARFLPDSRYRDIGRFAKVNGDAQADYIVVSQDDNGERMFAVYPGTPIGTFGSRIDTTFDGSNNNGVPFVSDANGVDSGTFADVNGDGRDDYVVVYKGTDEHRYFATYLSDSVNPCRFMSPIVSGDTAGNPEVPFFLDTDTGRDLGSFARVTSNTHADYVVVWPDAQGRRNITVYAGQPDGTFVRRSNTVSEAGRFMGDSTNREYGFLDDAR